MIRNEDYIRVELIPVNQKGFRFFVGKVQAADMLEVYTVNPVEYDLKKQEAFKKTFAGDEEYFNYLINESNRKIEEFQKKGFQRDFDTTRVNKIGRFIDEEEYSFFPNTIIVTCELINQHVPSVDKFDPSVFEEVSWPHNLSYFEEGDACSIYIPKIKSSLIVVDGQHRIEGLKRASKRKIEDYELLVSFMIGFDRSVVANLFYTINYTQKSVNKSLLYHLMTEFSDEIDEMTFMHEVVKLLNESNSSPFYKRVKMLGKSDKYLPDEIRNNMTVSQAFLIDYLIFSIEMKRKKSIVAPIFYPYYRINKGVFVIRFIARFFIAVRDLYGEEWDKPKESVLSKTTGVGALIKVMNYFFIKLAVDNNFIENPSKIDEFDSTKIKAFLDGIQNTELAEYSKAGSAGKLNQLKKDFIGNIGWFDLGGRDIDDYFKEHYLESFYEWIDSVQ